MDEQELIDLTEDGPDHVDSPNLTRLSSRLESVEIDENQSGSQRTILGRSNDPVPGSLVSRSGTSFNIGRSQPQNASGISTPEHSKTPKRRAESGGDLRERSHHQDSDTRRLDRQGDSSWNSAIVLDSSSSSDSDLEISPSDHAAKRQRIGQMLHGPPITLSDSDSEPEQQAGFRRRRVPPHRDPASGIRPGTTLLRIPPTSQTVIIDDEDEGEGVDDNEPYSILPNLQSEDDEIQILRTINRRDSHFSPGIREIDDFRERKKGFRCARGKCVQLVDGSFIRITSIVEDQDQKIWIVGPLFLRHNDFNHAKWPRRHNELVLISKVMQGEPVKVVRRPISDILRNRQLILTNQIFPFVSSRTHPDAFSNAVYDKQYGPLFCRWKQNQVIGENAKKIEESIERLSFAEADEQYRKDDVRARLSWRGRSLQPGDDQRISTADTGSANVYTFGDAFCGGGGASCGAREAGLKIKFGVDFDQKAMETYTLNFGSAGADCQQDDVFTFLDKAVDRSRYVDVLHMSPPCQPYSPAHTVANVERDEMNQAALFSVGELLDKARPRVATLEETFGLFSHHPEWFNALIKMFIDKAYSVRWTVAHLEQWGLPQKRRRLLIIGAGLGDDLPHFPKPTHSETDTSLRALATIHSTISAIPPNAPNHDLQVANFGFMQRKAAYSAHTQAKTITCSGGQGNHHPSGLRAFTMRELACLQCFPMSYKFADLGVTDLRRQIGNAVPPYVFKKIYREVKESLKRADEKAYERA